MELPQVPNKRLRLQRRLRGWSQEDVVAGLHRLAAGLGESEPGVDATMVSRWERGVRRPRPRYVRLLSTLFELPAEQLGMVQEDLDLLPERATTLEDDATQRRDLVARLATILDSAALPPGFALESSEPWERLSSALSQRTRVDLETVAHLERLTIALENLEPTRVGSRALLGPVT